MRVPSHSSSLSLRPHYCPHIKRTSLLLKHRHKPPIADNSTHRSSQSVIAPERPTLPLTEAPSFLARYPCDRTIALYEGLPPPRHLQTPSTTDLTTDPNSQSNCHSAILSHTPTNCQPYYPTLHWLPVRPSHTRAEYQPDRPITATTTNHTFSQSRRLPPIPSDTCAKNHLTDSSERMSLTIVINFCYLFVNSLPQPASYM
jgi:hypothetical protein